MGITVDINRDLGTFKLHMSFQSESSRIGILGASGCGKSMTLKSIAGIEKPDSGKIQISGHTVFDSSQKVNEKPQKRNIGYLFQNYALFPTMTVEQNIMAGLKGSRSDNKKRAEYMLEKFQLGGLAKHLPGQLSGGQQQRVALARIMAYEPEAILLDEPFSALDIFLKNRLQQEMEEMLSDYKGTVLLVSHNRDEVYRFSEELIIMDKGEAVTFGKTKAIFTEPVYKAAAKLTGCKNFADIVIKDPHTVEVPDWGLCLRLKNPVPADRTCIGYRAHDFVPVWGEPQENCMKMQVESHAELPFEEQYYIKAAGEPVCWFVQRELCAQIREKGLPDYLALREEDLMFLK